ncbi:nucleotide sugar dehydrogenase [Candidatus Pelagibacter sp.]|nr:nucleotide sugar dehydrogenase [Candidatus Pelagibacter sp.]
MEKISVVGMGYVGTAMATLIASIKKKNSYQYFVRGIEQNNDRGISISKMLNKGILPFDINDKLFKKNFYHATRKKKNLICSNSIKDISDSKIVIVSINCDLKQKNKPDVDLQGFLRSIKTILENLNQDALLIIESTIPPGTCELKILPMIKDEFKKRKIKLTNFLLAYTYERVMPGSNYLDSIKNYWRVMAGLNKSSAIKCRNFLSKIINVKKFPLTELDSIRACELGKILENSFRATNIAFIEEWARFAELMNIDIYKVIEAIRLRPTHANIRHPGFGVGGYCLTKDPLFGEYSAKKIWKLNNLDFPFSKQSIKINNKMPLVTLKKIKEIFNNKIKNKKILILGVSYKENVGDLRSSPSLYFINQCIKEKANIYWHDPYIKNISISKTEKLDKIKNFNHFDIIVLAVGHEIYKNINFLHCNFKDTIVFDANYTLTRKQINKIIKNKIKFQSIGR